jgi:membrane protein DedA with SNARE-associated domain
MTLETIITQFGYPALVIGLLLEGETVLVLGAFMAHRGYLNLPLVILTGLIVAFASDQFFFWMGHTKGNEFLEKRPAWAPNVGKAKSLLSRNTIPLFLGVRFMYGLRTVLPFVIGMNKTDPKRFVFLNFIGSFIWALIFGLAGYLFGHFMELLFDDIHRHEYWIALGIVLIGGSVWLYRRYSEKNGWKKMNNQSVEKVRKKEGKQGELGL